MKIIEKILYALSVALNAISFVCFAGIMLFIVADVMLRFLFNSPILGSFEIVEQLMLVGVFGAFAYAQMNGTHIHVSMLLNILPKKLGIFIYGLGELAVAVVCGILCYSFFLQAVLAFERNYTTVILKFSTVPSFVIIGVAAGVFCLTLLFSAIKSFMAISNETYREEILSTWN